MCVELVTGIAAASGGQCVLLSPTQRLQTKVSTLSHTKNVCMYTMTMLMHTCMSHWSCMYTVRLIVSRLPMIGQVTYSTSVDAFCRSTPCSFATFTPWLAPV